MAHCSSCGLEFTDQLAGCPACEEADGPLHRCARCEEEFRGSDACPACGALREPVACQTHPERSARGRCVICGRTVCERCRGRDRHVTLCEEHRSVPIIEGWAQVYRANSEFEARLLCENLHAEGIDAQVFSQRDTIFSVDLGELGIVRLLVPVWEYQNALAVIREHMDSDGEVAFACQACGEAYELGARECTGCGAPLG